MYNHLWCKSLDGDSSPPPPTTTKKIPLSVLLEAWTLASLTLHFLWILYILYTFSFVHKGSRKQIMPSNGNIWIWLIAQKPITDYIPLIELFHLTLHAAIYPNIFLTAQSKCYFSCYNSFIYIMSCPLWTKGIFIALFFKNKKQLANLEGNPHPASLDSLSILAMLLAFFAFSLRVLTASASVI